MHAVLLDRSTMLVEAREIRWGKARRRASPQLERRAGRGPVAMYEHFPRYVDRTPKRRSGRAPIRHRRTSQTHRQTSTRAHQSGAATKTKQNENRQVSLRASAFQAD